MTEPGYRIAEDHATRRAGGLEQDPFVILICGCSLAHKIRASQLEQTPTPKIGLLCTRCAAVHAIPRAELERAFMRLRR